MIMIRMLELQNLLIQNLLQEMHFQICSEALTRKRILVLIKRQAYQKKRIKKVMMLERYKFIEDPSADVLYNAYGNDLKELFSNTAEAMFSVICDLDKVEHKKEEVFKISGEDLDTTLFNWLAGLLAIIETEGMFFSKFEIIEVDEGHIKARLYGEPIREEIKKEEIAAVTNYKFDVIKTDDGYEATVSIDLKR
ncbi:hypothetical protein GF336_00530 [Candidatus Woesearchaeota archaeon]|nr:hypothetical protein [Candidatus Woesearchaeota archaeon]